MTRKISSLLFATTLMLFSAGMSGDALAQGRGRGAWGPGPGGPGMHGFGPGFGPGARFGRGGGCGRALMFGSPDVLKGLGLSDDQIKQVQTLRTNMMTKQITHRSQVQLLGLQMRDLMQADLPDEAKVLAVHRKMRSLRGKMAEERIKARIKVLSMLSAEQRKKAREICPLPGGHFGQGPGGKRGFRRGGGWGGGF